MECDPKQNSAADVELKINGESVELNTFVQNFISQTLIGMVKPLRGVDEVETIEVKVSSKPENS
jgi:hypothetical protein